MECMWCRAIECMRFRAIKCMQCRAMECMRCWPWKACSAVPYARCSRRRLSSATQHKCVTTGCRAHGASACCSPGVGVSVAEA
eukprot:365832-Chlamydomonas_euryale.AAC.19